jgi:ferric-dicitrate binding protein FerR (iron transport regulator)
MMRARTACSVIAALVVFTVLSAGQGSGEAAPVLGRLTIQGTVGIDAGAGDIEVSAPSHPYRAGERIATHTSSKAILTLRGGSIAIDSESEVTVTGEASRYRIDLDAGALRVRFGASSSFELSSGSVRVQFPAAEAKPTELGKAVDMLIAASGNGLVATEVYEGAVAVGDATAGSSRVVRPEERAAFRVGAGPVSAEEERRFLEGVSPWLLGVGGVTGTGAVGTGLYYLTDDDRSESPRTSPVR